MADQFSPEKRSEIMSKIRGKNTVPELLVRKVAYRLGFRFRLHRADLPGKPDLVFSGARKVVFVNGCFWHWHNCRAGRRTPKSNVEYWVSKRQRNRERDRHNRKALRKLGWSVLVIWQCHCLDVRRLEEALKSFLGEQDGE